MFLKKKKFAKGLDRMVLTGSCGPTSVLTVHGINKKSGSLGLKNRFPSRFPVFTVWPPGSVWFWKQCLRLLQALVCKSYYQKSLSHCDRYSNDIFEYLQFLLTLQEHFKPISGFLCLGSTYFVEIENFCWKYGRQK